MAQLDRDTLKTYFETGDFPTESNFIDFIDSVLNFDDDGTPVYDISGLEPKIYIPTPQPSISAGDLTLDIDSNRQAMFEPDAINEDFNFVISNDTNALLLSCVLSLTGTRIITFESDVLVSNASSIGTWAAPNLTLTAGTDDLIEFQLLRYSTSSKWILKVGEVAV